MGRSVVRREGCEDEIGKPHQQLAIPSPELIGRQGASSVLARHSVLDTESSRALWIPASAGMTNSRQAAGYRPSTKMMETEKVLGALIRSIRNN